MLKYFGLASADGKRCSETWLSSCLFAHHSTEIPQINVSYVTTATELWCEHKSSDLQHRKISVSHIFLQTDRNSSYFTSLIHMSCLNDEVEQLQLNCDALVSTGWCWSETFDEWKYSDCVHVYDTRLCLSTTCADTVHYVRQRPINQRVRCECKNPNLSARARICGFNSSTGFSFMYIVLFFHSSFTLLNNGLCDFLYS